MRNQQEMSSFWKNPLVLICIVALGYWIYTYHLEHAMGFLPYLILLLCPLMHIFMHKGHGHGGHGHQGCDHDDHKKHEGGDHA
jgi:hypothetical protein